MMFGLVNEVIAMDNTQKSKINSSAKIDEDDFEMVEEVINPVEEMMFALSEQYELGRLIATQPDVEQFEKDLHTLHWDVQKEKGPVFDRLKNALINEFFYNVLQNNETQSIKSQLCDVQQSSTPALCMFVMKPYPTLAALGIYAGGDVNLRYPNKESCVSLSIIFRHDLLANLLIQKGADLLAPGGSKCIWAEADGMTSLHHATYHKDLYWMTMLLSMNRDLVNIPNGKGQTPLHCVVTKTDYASQDDEIVLAMQQAKLLLDHGARLDSVDDNDQILKHINDPMMEYVLYKAGYEFKNLRFLDYIQEDQRMQSILKKAGFEK